MLFITLRSFSAQQVPKVLAVVEQTRRLRYKSGMEETDPLFQYVVYDTPQPKGPKRINLDDAPKKSPYSPPTSLTVHLSKIDMPELRPRADPSAPPSNPKTRPGKVTETARPVSLIYDNAASSTGKKEKEKDKLGMSSAFGILGLGKSDSRRDSKHKKGPSSFFIFHFIPT